MSTTLWLILIFIFVSGFYIYINFKVKPLNSNNNNNNNNNNIENFTELEANNQNHLNIIWNTSKNDIKFEDICTLYLKNMNAVNKSSRGIEAGGDYSELSNAYYSMYMISDISNDEKTFASSKINDEIDKLAYYKPEYYDFICSIFDVIDNITIAKGNSKLEAGMPHTHNNIIIMNDRWFQKPKFSTFIHELIHIHQRYNFNIYSNLYKQLNFQFVKITGFDNIVIRNRHNPDSFIDNIRRNNESGRENSDSGRENSDSENNNRKEGEFWDWIWYCDENKRYYWIGAVFTSITPNSLTDVEYLAYELTPSIEKKSYFYNGTTPIKLSKFLEFNKYFANIDNNNYQPNEIIAELIEKIITSYGIFANNNNIHSINTINKFISN